jgi:hypothetical protein
MSEIIPFVILCYTRICKYAKMQHNAGFNDALLLMMLLL